MLPCFCDIEQIACQKKLGKSTKLREELFFVKKKSVSLSGVYTFITLCRHTFNKEQCIQNFIYNMTKIWLFCTIFGLNVDHLSSKATLVAHHQCYSVWIIIFMTEFTNIDSISANFVSLLGSMWLFEIFKKCQIFVI